MAIRIRRGNQVDFDKNKLVQGELAIVLDAGELHFCYGAGNTKRLATKEDLQEMLNASETSYSALLQLIADLENDPNELTNILNNISALQSGKLDKTGDTKDNITTFAEAETDEDISTGEKHSTIFGKLLKSIKTLRHNIGVLASEKLDKSSIVQTDTINDTTKVPSSAVTYALGQEIDTLNNNLTDLKITRGYGNTAGLILSTPASVNDLKETGIYKLDGATPDMPASAGHYTAVLEVIKASALVALQRLTVVYSAGEGLPIRSVYLRTFFSPNWSDWETK